MGFDQFSESKFKDTTSADQLPLVGFDPWPSGPLLVAQSETQNKSPGDAGGSAKEGEASPRMLEGQVERSYGSGQSGRAGIFRQYANKESSQDQSDTALEEQRAKADSYGQYEKDGVCQINAYLERHRQEKVMGGMLDLTTNELARLGQTHVFNYINLPASFPRNKPFSWKMESYFARLCHACENNHNTFANMTLQGKFAPDSPGRHPLIEARLILPDGNSLKIRIRLKQDYANIDEAIKDEESKFKARFDRDDFFGRDDRENVDNEDSDDDDDGSLTPKAIRDERMRKGINGF